MLRSANQCFRVFELRIPHVLAPRASIVCFLAIAMFGLSGCGTPMAVKKLSAEQVKVNASFEQALKSYFDLIEKFTANQIAVSNATIDDTTKQIIQLRKRQALAAVKSVADDQARQKALDDLADASQAEMQTATTDKAQIADLFAKLKSKHKEMLAAFAAIKAAQEKLDTYIQLKKADETAFDELLSAVGISKDTLNRDATEISNNADQITNLAKSK